MEAPSYGFDNFRGKQDAVQELFYYGKDLFLARWQQRAYKNAVETIGENEVLAVVDFQRIIQPRDRTRHKALITHEIKLQFTLLYASTKRKIR